MEAMIKNSDPIKELISEIFTKINNAKDKPKKIEVVKTIRYTAMRMILKGELLIQR